jgi:hypothetical protein
MPFEDIEKRRSYDREYKRRLRATEGGRLAKVAPETRLRVAEDVEALLTEAVFLARYDPKARNIEKARTLAHLATVALRLIETQNLQDRVESLERILEMRRSG